MKEYICDDCGLRWEEDEVLSDTYAIVIIILIMLYVFSLWLNFILIPGVVC